MSNIDDLFENDENTKEESVSPRLKLNWKEEESARVRLTQDLRAKDPEGRMKIMVRHYVENVGYVECGQPQGLKKVKDEKTPTLWSTKFYKDEDDVPDWAKPYIREAKGGYTAPACKFCHERSVFKKEHGGDNMNKDDQKIMGKLHKRKVDIIAKAEAQVFDKNGKPVGELEPKAVVFDGIDLFFPQQNKQYKQLVAKTAKKKGTLTKTWLTIDAKGVIDFDGEVTKEESKRPVDVDLEFFDRQTKPYEDGLKIYLEKKESSDQAEPLEEDEETNTETTSDEPPNEEDEEIIF